MTRFAGRLYDGRTSSVVEVDVHVSDAGELIIKGHDRLPIHFKDIIVSSRIAGTPRFLDLPDGARIETRAQEEIDMLCAKWGKKKKGIVHKLENNMPSAMAALVVLVAVGYFSVVFGIPAASGFITSMLPTALDDRLGGEVMQSLDDLVFEPTELPDRRQVELQNLFESLAPRGNRNYRLDFRSSEIIGANAFALPDAQIIFTDQIVELANDEDMIAAIMLHEIGHVVERHAMRSVVGQAGFSMLIFALTGDINSATTTLILLLPNFMIQSRYSRDLEWEADTYALEEMLDRGIDPGKFSDMMERITDIQVSDTLYVEDTEESPGLEYFQSHPPTRLRIQRFRAAAHTPEDRGH